MSNVKWSFTADFIQACNCDYGCPCEFSAPPTLGYCEGVGAWRIERGNYGDVTLDGLGVGFAAHWPKALHEGNGTCGLMMDERASEAQRQALFEICSGRACGLPFEIIVTTFSKILSPRFVAFKFNLNGRHSSVEVGDFMTVATEPIKNPVTGEPESVRVQHATGFMFQEAECVSGARMNVDFAELKFSWPNKAAFVARVTYGN